MDRQIPCPHLPRRAGSRIAVGKNVLPSSALCRTHGRQLPGPKRWFLRVRRSRLRRGRCWSAQGPAHASYANDVCAAGTEAGCRYLPSHVC
ncbi:hypothetical protein EMPG_11356 [Blastomyces silverae]|uniref:Uncharacterized protein n=1 Tax=Blastomyces silverae TaxID=2060906 RepID=A0A0H1BQV3_9EURO|nr:hypothetical protein EMPG_11356 [Blastomyces silverae]